MKPSVLKQLGVRATVLVAVTFLGACAKLNEGGLWLATSKVDAFLLVNGQLLTGDARLAPDRTGRVTFAANGGVVRSCGGALRYTASRSGQMDIQCNDGTQVTLEFTALSETKGYGYGTTPQGIASVTFGYSEEDAQAFLKLPPGKKLVQGADGVLSLQ